MQSQNKVACKVHLFLRVFAFSFVVSIFDASIRLLSYWLEYGLEGGGGGGGPGVFGGWGEYKIFKKWLR